MEINSQNYSAIKTPIPLGAALPPIMVQMPVYKESLEEVCVWSPVCSRSTLQLVTLAHDSPTKHILNSTACQATWHRLLPHTCRMRGGAA